MPRPRTAWRCTRTPWRTRTRSSTTGANSSEEPTNAAIAEIALPEMAWHAAECRRGDCLPEMAWHASPRRHSARLREARAAEPRVHAAGSEDDESRATAERAQPRGATIQ